MTSPMRRNQGVNSKAATIAPRRRRPSAPPQPRVPARTPRPDGAAAALRGEHRQPDLRAGARWISPYRTFPRSSAYPEDGQSTRSASIDGRVSGAAERRPACRCRDADRREDGDADRDLRRRAPLIPNLEEAKAARRGESVVAERRRARRRTWRLVHDLGPQRRSHAPAGTVVHLGGSDRMCRPCGHRWPTATPDRAAARDRSMFSITLADAPRYAASARICCRTSTIRRVDGRDKIETVALGRDDGPLRARA